LYTLFGVLSYSVALFIFAVSPWFPLSIAMACLLGMTNSIQAIPRNSAILAMSPDGIRGRVEAFRSMLAGGGPSIGFTISGALAAVVGAPLAVSIGAIACAALVISVGVVDRNLRDPNLGSQD